MRSGAVLCPLCYGLYKVHGCYRRHCRDENGDRHFGWVAQVHCSTCNKYPALIPHFIMSHKHFKTEVIESVIAASEDAQVIEGLGGCAADVSTMRRWIRQFRERGAEAVGWLLSKLLAVNDHYVGSLELRNRTLLNQLARLLRGYQAPKNGGVIGRVNIILTTQNCGFL